MESSRKFEKSEYQLCWYYVIVIYSCCVRRISAPETINNCTGAPYQPTPTTPSEAPNYNNINEALYHQHFWDHVHIHQRDSENTTHVSITLLITTSDQNNVIDLGIKRCLPTAGHYTLYQCTRSGRRVFIKLCNTARSIVTNISLQRSTTPKQSKPNFSNLHTVPIKHKDQPGTDDNKVHLSLVNTRSLPSKGEELKYYITEKAINICAVTETLIHKDATEE